MKAKVLVDNITKNQWKAEWGLSIYIEYNGHRILLDTGTTEAFAENDDFSHEQSLVFDTKEGLVIFNSCSHGGADVIIREAEAAFPGKQIYGLIGGFHLFRSEDQEVRELADRIRKTGIRRICTGHCTGERAMEILKEELGDMAEQIYTGFEIEV